MKKIIGARAVADAEFPRRRGGATQPSGGSENLFFSHDICQKLHENERNWIEKGHVSLVPPTPDPVTKAVSKGEGTPHPHFLHFHAVFKKKNLKIEPSVLRSLCTIKKIRHLQQK